MQRLAINLINNCLLISDYIDIDECNTANGGCSHTCVNTPGSFICYCNDGYSLDSNGLTCSGKIIIY